MRVSITVIALLAAMVLIAGVRYDPGPSVSSSIATSPDQAAATAQAVHPSQATELARMQQKIALLESRLQALESRSVAAGGGHVDPSRPVPPLSQSDTGQRRAEGTEQRQAFMANLAQSFREERVDPTWSASAKSRILAMFDADAALRGLTHSVDCRGHTCRVEVHEGDGEVLTERLPLLALGLGDILPRISTERVSLGAGSALVVYLSATQPGVSDG